MLAMVSSLTVRCGNCEPAERAVQGNNVHQRATNISRSLSVTPISLSPPEGVGSVKVIRHLALEDF